MSFIAWLVVRMYSQKISRGLKSKKYPHHKISSLFSPKTKSYNYRLQTKFAKVMFLHLSVSHCLQGGCLPQCMLRYIPPEQTPQEQTPPPVSKHPFPLEQTAPRADTFCPAQCMLRDTGNKWAVRILLECILVAFDFTVRLNVQKHRPSKLHVTFHDENIPFLIFD